MLGKAAGLRITELITLWSGLAFLLALLSPTPGDKQLFLLADLVNLDALDPQDEAGFGASVAVDGEVAVVGASMDDESGFPDVGTAAVYRRTGGIWSLEARLSHPEPIGSGHFGQAVAVSSDVILIGARAFANAEQRPHVGVAYVFRHDGSSWTFETRLEASDEMDDSGVDFSDILPPPSTRG